MSNNRHFQRVPTEILRLYSYKLLPNKLDLFFLLTGIIVLTAFLKVFWTNFQKAEKWTQVICEYAILPTNTIIFENFEKKKRFLKTLFRTRKHKYKSQVNFIKNQYLPGLLMLCAELFQVKAQHNLVIKTLGNIPVLNSPVALPHHFSEGSHSPYILFIHDRVLNLNGRYFYALLSDSYPFLGIAIGIMICC